MLDFGAGYGREAIHFAKKGYQVTALEACEAAVDRMRKLTPQSSFIQKKGGSITFELLSKKDENLNYETNSFDFVHSSRTVHLLPGIRTLRLLLEEWKRILKPGGALAFSLPSSENDLALMGREIAPGLYEALMPVPATALYLPMRSMIFNQKESVRMLCAGWDLREIGWFGHAYGGRSSSWWQVLAVKP